MYAQKASKYLDCVAQHSLVSSSKARKDIYETGLGRSTISKDGCNSVIMYSGPAQAQDLLLAGDPNGQTTAWYGNPWIAASTCWSSWTRKAHEPRISRAAAGLCCTARPDAPVPVTTSNHREHGGQAGSSVGLLRGRPSLAHDRLKKAPHL